MTAHQDRPAIITLLKEIYPPESLKAYWEHIQSMPKPPPLSRWGAIKRRAATRWWIVRAWLATKVLRVRIENDEW